MPAPGRRLARDDTLARLYRLGSECEVIFRTYLVFPVVLGGRPETSACSSTGEPTTSKPWRPRMCCGRMVAGGGDRRVVVARRLDRDSPLRGQPLRQAKAPDES